MVVKVLGVYLLVLNLLGFTLAALNKRKAVKRRRRVSEAALFSAALAGGAAGMYLSMRLFHHKTLHKRFMLGLPAVMLLHLVAALLCWRLGVLKL